jgi:hypothetical protein
VKVSPRFRASSAFFLLGLFMSWRRRRYVTPKSLLLTFSGLHVFIGLETLKYGHRDSSRWPRDTLYPQTLALTSPTNGCYSVSIVRLRTKATELHSFISHKKEFFVTDDLTKIRTRYVPNTSVNCYYYISQTKGRRRMHGYHTNSANPMVPDSYISPETCCPSSGFCGTVSVIPGRCCQDCAWC